MSVFERNMSLISLLKKFKALDGFVKRGIIYCTIATLGISYELLFVRPIRPTVIILWTGVIGIGVIVILMLRKD